MRDGKREREREEKEKRLNMRENEREQESKQQLACHNHTEWVNYHKELCYCCLILLYNDREC